jgi:hypothetical protein
MSGFKVRTAPLRGVLLGLMLALSLCTVADSATAKKAKVEREHIVAPEVYLAVPPSFIRPSNQSYFVAIEVPYDLFYHAGSFYLHVRGDWFISDFYEGPWERVRTLQLPPVFRAGKVGGLRAVRDQAAREFAANKDGWPKDGLFVPESTVIEDDVLDEGKDGELLPPGVDPGQER